MTDAPTSDGSGSNGDRPVVLVSNRGPVSFTVGPDHELVARRGAGGLVSGLAPLMVGTDALWVAAAMSEGDRVAARSGRTQAEGLHTALLALDPEDYRMAYDVVGNATLWFLHHGLWELARRPRFDRHFTQAWDAFRRVNQAFAQAVADQAPPDAVVLVQDYHLSLLGPMLAERRPDLVAIHFSHTPFAGPDWLRVLPDAVAVELLEGLAGHHACGFHAPRWADAFAADCRLFLGRDPRTFVAPLAPDPDDLARVAASPACAQALAALEVQIGDRALIARVDRIELSKNLVRGFLAYDDLLDRYPQWRERVVFGAFVYPSREGLPEYLAYRQEVERVIDQVNQRWATPSWTPILGFIGDDHPRSIAALRRYDALLVNPVRDGLNLVAKEGALVNERDGVVLLSPEAGAWAELEGVVRRVHPFDITATADALADALATPTDRRAHEAKRLTSRARQRTPRDWLADQLVAANA
jgi:trehalose 6-phosphate synthase